MSTTEIYVRPTDYTSHAEYERLPLALMGQVIPGIYVQMAEVFSLAEGTDTPAIVKHMTAGLEYTLTQFAELTTTLEQEAKTGRMWLAKKRESGVKLHVKYMLGEDEFPEYSELERRDFPANMIVGHKILPTWVTEKQLHSPLDGNSEVGIPVASPANMIVGHKILPAWVTEKQLHSPLDENSEDGIPVATFQINFIRGGLILGIAVHHCFSDGPGCDGFLTVWAENSMAAMNGTAFVPAKDKFVFEGSVLDVSEPDEAPADEEYPILIDRGAPMPAPPADFQMPQISQVMWHFPASKLEALKKKASDPNGEAWVSTYDSILALLWGSITRAKLDLCRPDMESTAIAYHAVDMRKRIDPPLPDNFLGVAIALGRAGALQLKNIVAPENLPLLAASIRSSINVMTPQYYRGMLQWIASRADKRYLGIQINSFLGMDFGATSWRSMSCYEKHNFGFGWPKALRWPSPMPMLEGFVFLYPSRTSQKYVSEDEGVEVCICLETACMERLSKDNDLLEFAKPRGGM